jgi:hypothetical protein
MRLSPELLCALSRGRIRAVNHRIEILRSVKGTKLMKRFILLLPLVLSLGSCSIYSKCVKPEVGKITWTGTAQELGEVVESMLLCDPGFSAADVPPCAIQALQDFAESLGPDGIAVENCVLNALEGNASSPAQARAKAMGAKRGIHAAALECHGRLALRSPGDSKPPEAPAVFRSLWDCPGSSIIGTHGDQIGCFDQGMSWLGPIVPLPLTADITASSAPLARSEVSPSEFEFVTGPGWYRVRGGALVKWQGDELGWTAVTLADPAASAR